MFWNSNRYKETQFSCTDLACDLKALRNLIALGEEGYLEFQYRSQGSSFRKELEDEERLNTWRRETVEEYRKEITLLQSNIDTIRSRLESL